MLSKMGNPDAVVLAAVHKQENTPTAVSECPSAERQHVVCVSGAVNAVRQSSTDSVLVASSGRQSD